MIKKIRTIKNIGSYRDSGNPQIEFDKFVTIFGYNSYGKSTICDIFRSYKLNAPQYIEKRKSIGTKDAPLVVFSFQEGNEKTLKYVDGTWSNPNGVISKPSNIEIFDTEFVNVNVLDMLVENTSSAEFSDFILGEFGVALMKDIQECEKDLQGKTTIINEYDTQITSFLVEVYQELKSRFGVEVPITEKIDIKGILKIKTSKSVKEIDNLCLSTYSSLTTLRRNKKNIDEIKRTPLMQSIRLVNDELMAQFDDINYSLQETFPININELMSVLEQHIDNTTTTDVTDFQNWALRGYNFWKKDDSCPFCGSIIDKTKGNASELIKAYSMLLTDNIKSYVAKLKQEKNFVTTKKYIDFSDVISSFMAIMQEGILLIQRATSPEIEKIIREINNKLAGVENSIKEYCSLLNIVSTQFQSALQDKLEKLSDKGSIIDLTDLKEKAMQVSKMVSDINALIEEANNKCVAYFTALTIDSMSNQILTQEQELIRLMTLFCRAKHNDLFMLYDTTTQHIKGLKKEISAKKDKLSQDQTKFLATYFDETQSIFRSLGSIFYNIEKKTIKRRGKSDGIGIAIKFKDQNIAQEDIRFVFSESDKRALALAVFLAKIKINANPETIVFFDDAITSFDSDRIKAFITIVKQLASNSLNQAFFLTHYETFFRKAVALISDNNSLIKIDREQNNHNFVKVNKRDEPLLKDEYERFISEIINFVNGTTDNINQTTLRFYLQKYLEYKFAKEIRNGGVVYQDLNSLICSLCDNTLINIQTATELHSYRTILNEPSHNWDDDTPESKRTVANNLYEFLHEKL